MSNSNMKSHLFTDLSTEEQELLSGGYKRCCRWRRHCVRYCHTPSHHGGYRRNDGEPDEDSGSQES